MLPTFSGFLDAPTIATLLGFSIAVRSGFARICSPDYPYIYHIIIYGRCAERANVAADTALRLDADVSVFWTASKVEASISARLRAPLDKELGINLGTVMQEMGKIVGGNGGGHACAAGAYGPKRESAQEAGEEAVRRIKEKMSAAPR